MLIKEFRSNYRQKVEEQIEIAAYMEAEQIKKAVPADQIAADVTTKKALDLIVDSAKLVAKKVEKKAAKKSTAKKSTAKKADDTKAEKKPAAKKTAAKKPAAKKTAKKEEDAE
jgi:DNA topoisomerase-1